MPDVLVFGAGGQLGTGLQAAMRRSNVSMVAVPRSIDVSDANAVREVVTRERPTWIVNAAAMTDVDGAHRDPDRAFHVNALGAGNVAAAAQALGARTVQISTEAVFDGEQQAPYREDDACRPVSVYGASKRAGESLVRILDPASYVLRTSWLYGAVGGANFPTRLLANLRKGPDDVPVVTDIVGNPTPVAVLADAIVALMARPCPAGTYHVCCRGAASKFEWAVSIAEHAGFDPGRIVPVTSASFPTPAARPKHVDLNVERFEATGLMPLPDWQEAWRTAAAG